MVLRARWAALPAAAALLASACASSAFQADSRLRVVTPRDRAQVSLPVRVAWTAPEVKGATSYLVVVDRAPQPEGQTVSFFVKGDEACKGLRLQSCLSADYLTTRGIYLTAARQLTLAAVAEQDTVWASARRQHDVFVVPLDRAGRRLGEASASVHLVLPRAADGG